MEFTYGKQDVSSMERGQENCYLLTNGLGGYSSLTMIGSCARNDHALFMAAVKAPNQRCHMLSKIEEQVQLNNHMVQLSAQEYVDYTKNEKGYAYLDCFYQDIFPVWIYRIEGIEIRKSLTLQYGKNTLGISYQIKNESSEEAVLLCKPWMQFAKKGEAPHPEQSFVTTDKKITSAGQTLYFDTNGRVNTFQQEWIQDFYYAYDARDGRAAVGRAAANHEIIFQIPPLSEQHAYIIYRMDEGGEAIEALFHEEKCRQKLLVQKAELTDRVAQQLVLSGDCFLVQRASTGGKTILAGYPFFGDWGRDTMIAVSGILIVTQRFEEAKSIFRSFLQYMKKGLMPNLFPESGQEPQYNTVDAALLFILAVYEYYHTTEDRAFLAESMAAMEDIIYWYQKGTDYHIKMEEDGLISAGKRLEQVTWMDVRYRDVLPTPRHGKPVEINVWWYNALRAVAEMQRILGREPLGYDELAERVKNNFQQQFWNEAEGCLRDTISTSPSDLQVRCNQIWAVSAPFSILDRSRERKVVEKVYCKLYTPYGLRTLSPEDPQFCGTYGGSMYERDMAYHQGTVWPFPLGAYYLAYLKVNEFSRQAKERVRNQLKPMEACLREGCIGQIAEIYDGLVPGCSKGCFAQAWSVGEILKVYHAIQHR